jgi:hypothetical protein
MIINGRSRRCVWWWSKHLQDLTENERVRVVKVDGLASENIHDLLCEIEAQGLGTRCRNPLWIAAINPGPKEYFSEQDRDRAREILEQERGYQGQPYFMVEHEKKGWKHWHVVYSRIDAEHMRALPDGLDARVCHAAARRIENEFGLQKVIGPFDREKGTPRPARAPEPWEMYRGMQTKIDPREIEREITALFRQSETGLAFKAALESQGYQLATGKRGLLILDSAGKEHSLARRIEGTTTKDLNAFMRDVDRDGLPTVEQGKEQFQKRKVAGLEADRATVLGEIEWEEKLARAAIEKEEKERQFVEPELRNAGSKERAAGAGSRKEERLREQEQAQETRQKAVNERHWPTNPEAVRGRAGFEEAATKATHDQRPDRLKGPAARLWQAWERYDTEKIVDASMSGKPVSFRPPDQKDFAASLDELGYSFAVVTKDEAYRSDREFEFTRAVGRYAPCFKEGEIVLVTEQRHEYRRTGQIVVPDRVYKLDQSLAEKFVKHLSIRGELQGIDATLKSSDLRAEKRAADRDAERMARATDIKDFSREISNDRVKGKVEIGKSAIRSISKTLTVLTDAIDSLLAPKLTPQQMHDGEIAKGRREAQAEDTIDFARYTAETAQHRQQREQELESQRQRQRERGGRER